MSISIKRPINQLEMFEKPSFVVVIVCSRWLKSISKAKGATKCECHQT
jgi:hypothetical protein